MRFSDIIGNERAVERVRRLIDTDRLPHALLLHGPVGVPKLALARTMAQYLHCTNHTDGEPCGVCPACKQHQSFNNTDTFFIYPYAKKAESSVCEDFLPEWQEFLRDNEQVESYERWLKTLRVDNKQPQIYANDSNAILRKANLTSFTSRYKVFIIWLPEKMNSECANKLLKILEEPSADCKFIMVSDDASEILPTIFSRTQRIELSKPSTAVVADYLVSRYGIDPQDALALAAPADGNVPLAERALEQDNEQHEFHEQFVSLMRLAYVRDLVSLKAWSEGIAAFKREKSRRFLAYCTRQVRENFVYNLHVPSLNYLTREEQQFSTRFAPYINEQNVERMLAEFSRAESDIQGNGNANIILFDLAVRITILTKT